MSKNYVPVFLNKDEISLILGITRTIVSLTDMSTVELIVLENKLYNAIASIDILNKS